MVVGSYVTLFYNKHPLKYRVKSVNPLQLEIPGMNQLHKRRNYITKDGKMRVFNRYNEPDKIFNSWIDPETFHLECMEH